MLSACQRGGTVEAVASDQPTLFVVRRLVRREREGRRQTDDVPNDRSLPDNARATPDQEHRSQANGQEELTHPILRSLKCSCQRCLDALHYSNDNVVNLVFFEWHAIPL